MLSVSDLLSVPLNNKYQIRNLPATHRRSPALTLHRSSSPEKKRAEKYFHYLQGHYQGRAVQHATLFPCICWKIPLHGVIFKGFRSLYSENRQAPRCRGRAALTKAGWGSPRAPRTGSGEPKAPRSTRRGFVMCRARESNPSLTKSVGFRHGATRGARFPGRSSETCSLDCVRWRERL